MRTARDELQHAGDVAACTRELEKIGKTYAKLVMQKAIIFNLEPDQVEECINALVQDFGTLMATNGICKEDAKTGAAIVRQALISEARCIACLLPDSEATMQ